MTRAVIVVGLLLSLGRLAHADPPLPYHFMIADPTTERCFAEGEFGAHKLEELAKGQVWVHLCLRQERVDALKALGSAYVRHLQPLEGGDE